MDETPLSVCFFVCPILTDRCRNRNFSDYCFTDTYLSRGPGFFKVYVRTSAWEPGDLEQMRDHFNALYPGYEEMFGGRIG